MNWRKVIILFVVVLSGVVLAQEEDDDFVEAEPAKLQVDSKDLKALEQAKANKSEEQIVKAASRILGVDSTHALALNTLGVFYFEQGKWGLARIIFNRALQTHADEPALHNNLGIVYLAEGKQRLALAEFRKALELKSGYRIGAANLGSILLEYRDYQRAIAPLAAGFKATRSELKSGDSSAAEVANNYAIALAATGKADDAQDVFEDIISGNSRNPTVLMNYAILLVEKLKNYKEANKMLSRIKFAVDDAKVLKKVEELEAKINSADK